MNRSVAVGLCIALAGYRGFTFAIIKPAFKLNTPVTFGYCDDDATPGCDEVFIRLDGERCNARFSLTYRDRDYHVANFNSANILVNGA